MRILSGIQPSGSLHIGNYFGMIKPMLEYQKKEELFLFIANLHALTSTFKAKELADNTLNAAIDLLALGIDPEKSFFWIQADIPEINELTWYLSNLTGVGLLERAHSYKDKTAKGIPANAGLFIYPVLMTADILSVQADKVPVGKDQKQHLEMARDIANRFNNAYGDIFKVPEPEINKEVAILPGIDGQKMSKSYENYIEIFGEEKTIKKKIMSIVTDSTPIEKPKDPEKCSVYHLYKLFASQDQVKEMADKLEAGGYGYGDAKKELFEVIWDYFAPYREKRAELAGDLGQVQTILKKGAEKTKKEIILTLEKVRQAIGVK